MEDAVDSCLAAHLREDAMVIREGHKLRESHLCLVLVNVVKVDVCHVVVQVGEKTGEVS